MTFEKLFDGTSSVLIQDGKIDERVKNNLKLTDQELEEALRLQGVDELGKVQKAIMETNGKISVIEAH